MEEKNNEIKEYPNCGHKMASDKEFCPSCMTPMTEETKEETPIEEIAVENAPAEETCTEELTTEEHVESEIPIQETIEETTPDIDPEIIAELKAEEQAKKKQKQKKIAIYSVIGAIVLFVGIILVTLLSAERISFDQDTATTYDAYGLTCYSPSGWVVREGTNEYDGKITGTYYYNKDGDIGAYVGIQYLGEFDKFNEVMDEAKKQGVPVDSFTKDKTRAGSPVLVNDAGWNFQTLIILCDRSGFLISGGATEELFEGQVLIDIIEATDFDSYSSKGICEYLGGHEVEEEAWEESVAPTCTEEGTETAKCTVCLQMVEREIPLAPHTVENGETTESTCTKEGSVTGTCSVCGAEVTEKLPLAEHTPGDWIVDTEATESSEGKRHKECTVCGKSMESESFTLTLDEIKATYNTGITYSQLSREPDTYEGEKVKFRGRVLQVIEGDYTTALRVATSGRWDNVIYVEYLKGFVESRVLEDDTITIYGKSKGLMSYKSTGSGTITIPSVSVDYIDQ